MKPKKTKSGKWHVTAYIGKVNGKNYYKSFTAATSRECTLMATDYINSFRKDPHIETNLTLGEAVNNYIDVKEKVLSPSTIKGYVSVYNHYLPPVCDIAIKDLTNYKLQEYISSCAYLSPKTVRNIYGLISAALNMYSDKKYNITLPAPVEIDRLVASDDDIKKMLEAASPELKKAIILGSCSLRRGEACALKYSDIEKDGVYVHADLVQNRYKEWVYKDHPKTPQSTRHVAMPPELIKALGHGNGYVVKLSSPDILTRYMERLSKRLGIKVTFQSLRRYYASICHALGIPDKFIMEQGGWKSENVMRKSYQHTLDKQSKEFQNIFNEHMKTNM